MQFGCGLSNPDTFQNFDSSLNLYFQRNLIFKWFWGRKPTYPENIRFGDIVKGLPIENNSLKGIYSSHVLEHLSYHDCKRALQNSYLYLSPGGIFRCVLPNLELLVKAYLDEKAKGNTKAANNFMEYSFYGYKARPNSLISLLKWHLTADYHFWGWDNESLAAELSEVGFRKVTKSNFGQSRDPVFNTVENLARFQDSIVLEAVK
jgi:predicted SAM-dependent methyltransferase